MAVTCDGTGYLHYAGVVASSLPLSILVWANDGSGGSTVNIVGQSQASRDDRYDRIAILSNGNVQASHAWATGNSGSATKVGPTLNSTMRVGIATFQAGTSPYSQCFYGDSTPGQDTSNNIVDQLANHDHVTIGGLHYNNTVIQLFSGKIAEVHFYAGILTGTHYTSAAGGALPESLPGWIDGWALEDISHLTSLGGTRTLTLVGGVTNAGSHPIDTSGRTTGGVSVKRAMLMGVG